MRSLVFLLIAGIVVSGCTANPYNKFYKPMMDAKTNPTIIPSTNEIAFYSTDDINRDLYAMLQKGYALIGYTSFNGGSDAASDQKLKQQAKKVGAQAVLISTRYTNTISGVRPVVLPNSSMTFSNGMATAYGNGISIQAYGNATSTTFGSQTAYIPFQQDRMDFNAMYFAKQKSKSGLRIAPIPNEIRIARQNNLGAFVEMVIDNSPAYIANIMQGDIITKYNDVQVISSEHFKELAKQFQGGAVNLEVERQGHKMQKIMTINQ